MGTPEEQAEFNGKWLEQLQDKTALFVECRRRVSEKMAEYSNIPLSEEDDDTR